MATAGRAEQFVVHALRATFADQPILERTVLTILPVILLRKAYLTELVPPYTIPPLWHGHFKESVADRQKLSELSSLAAVSAAA